MLIKKTFTKLKKEMWKMFNEPKFKNNLVTWFEINQREMPWRETSNPYYIWLSEVMLQQTQVKTPSKTKPTKSCNKIVESKKMSNNKVK